MVDVFVSKDTASDIDTGDMDQAAGKVERDYIAPGQQCMCPPHNYKPLPDKGVIAKEIREGNFLFQFEASKSKYREKGRKLVQRTWLNVPGRPRRKIEVIDHSK
jgi:hypothetical protein